MLGLLGWIIIRKVSLPLFFLHFSFVSLAVPKEG
jgi:hypothetical protein